ncbi:MAG: DNA/RNA non-specific endonuclease [Sulfurimonas sp.]|uniref:DNA/RNA non-specific endonuclease n=1 Tax=Sulfurimonas sp. TaxID=2022749 RepID=UPI002609DE7D|nr:DNA/RNA non-specific endonuclease [Sulfurimonas sp.]MDD5373348.1 DNA/RNA non-specific endonuclease [Sulfurimonas sp.]
MFKKISVLLVSCAASLSAAVSVCPTHYLDGTAPDIVNEKLSQKTQEVCYEGFGIVHSALTKSALYSAEYLTREKIAVKIPRKDEFHPEGKLPANDRSELSDYARSGYDRGHLTPSADMGSVNAQHDSFSLANMIPQDGTSNRGIWSAIEGATRHLANKEGGVFVITGTLYQGSGIKAIGRNNVLVPTQVYKVVFSPKQQKGAVYIVDNVPNDNYKIISIAELEKMSGINYFPKLTQAQKEKLIELSAPKKRG